MKNKNISLFLWAQLISDFAYSLLYSAISYHVIDITGGASDKYSLTLVMGTLPKVVFYQISGIVLDSFDKKRFFSQIDLVLSVMTSFILFLSFRYSVSYLSLSLALFVIASLKALGQPISNVIVPALVSKDRLLNINSYAISNSKLARTFGPILALALLAIVGFKISLILSVVLYLITYILKSRLTIDGSKIVNSNLTIREVCKRLFEGVNITLENRGVLILLINAVLTQIFIHPFISSMYPIIVFRLTQFEIVPILKILAFLNLNIAESSVWKSINLLLQLGGALGIILSMFYLSRMKNLSNRRGLSIGIFGISVFGLLISISITYFKLFDWSALNLIGILTFINMFLFFSFNIFTIFFSVHYQSKIDKDKLGRFVSNFFVLFALSYSIGLFIYGRLAVKGWLYPVIFLAIGSALKIILHCLFILYKRGEIE